ncbi:hypothetical protein CLOM621_08694 [Clostridium sp. M62/1]|nr:hypothetical protein CLOM621_08694 [Clostridium sp. M62/1]
MVKSLPGGRFPRLINAFRKNRNCCSCKSGCASSYCRVPAAVCLMLSSRGHPQPSLLQPSAFSETCTLTQKYFYKEKFL